MIPKYSPAQLRRFGWLLAALLAFAAWRSGGVLSPSLFVTAVLLFALATLQPTALRQPQRWLAALTWPVGWLVSQILLTIVFFGLIAPIALLFRLCRRDALQCRPDPNAATYWQPCNPMADGAAYARQF